MTQKSSENAALRGNLEILKWFQSNGCELSYSTFSNAAKNGNLEILLTHYK